MAYLHRHTDSNETYAIPLQPNGAMLYAKGLGFGIFVAGHYTSTDLDKVVEEYLVMIEEVDRLLEAWEGKM